MESIPDAAPEPQKQAEAEPRGETIKGRTVADYLRMPRAEFMSKMRQVFPDQIEGMDRRLDEYLASWLKRRMLLPSQSQGDSLYLAWVLNRVPNLDSAQKNTLLNETREPPHEVKQNILNILSLLVAARQRDRDLAAALNGEDTYTGEALAELMQADHDRLRDFIRSIARLKADQVDMGDETWLAAPEPVKSRALARRERHVRAYRNAVDHPWLDETDGKGRKRTRGEKETIVMGLMYNGPQPRTVEDERWRLYDKRQCMQDAFNSIVTQHEIIQGEWSGHPITPIWDAGAPNRFGRIEENKRVDMRGPYVKQVFHRVSPFGVWNPGRDAPLQADGQAAAAAAGGGGGGDEAENQ